MKFFYNPDWFNRPGPWAFTLEHVLFIAIAVIVGFVTAILLKKCSKRTIKIVLISLWGFVVALEVLKWNVIYTRVFADPTYPFDIETMLPLHSCSMFMYVFPFAMFNVVCVLLFVACIVVGALAIYHRMGTYYYGMIFAMAAWQVFICYFIFAMPAILVVYRDNKNIKLTKWNQFVAITTYIFYFFDFAFAFLDGFVFHPSKRKTWNKVEHSGEISNEDAKEVA